MFKLLGVLLQCSLLLFLFSVAKGQQNMNFTIIQYNVFGLPKMINPSGPEERTHRIPQALMNVNNQTDVITFCEAFVEHNREELMYLLSKFGFKYQTAFLKDPDPFTSLENGGVFIASRWPIVREDQFIYRGACTHSDCMAAKGAVYARIQKSENGASKIFNLFATHFQAWYDEEAKKARAKQASMLYEFVQAQKISHEEPVLFSGDFNVDMYHYPEELQVLVSTLRSNQPNVQGEQKFSSDPKLNQLVGKDGAAKDGGCLHEYEQTGTCTCCPQEYLDYVLYSQEYQAPVNKPEIRSIVLKSDAPFLVKWDALGDKHRNISDLSDHFPVISTLQFAVTGDVIVQDGCKRNADCVFKWGYCYCTGTGCTLDGKQVNGWDLGHKHPVNDDCRADFWKVQTEVCACTFKNRS